MSKELTDKTFCVLISTGPEIWINETTAIKLGESLKSGLDGMITLEGCLIKKDRIIGIIPTGMMEEHNKKKRGLWKCKYNNWHNRYDNCECGRQH